MRFQPLGLKIKIKIMLMIKFQFWNFEQRYNVTKIVIIICFFKRNVYQYHVKTRTKISILSFMMRRLDDGRD